jgi:hypothetical protein
MELLQNGLNEHIYLRKALMTLSKYFKYRGYDKETNKKMLIDWISKQNEEYYGSKYYRYSWEDILKYIDEVNNNTYKNNYRFIDKIEVPVTLGEMREINMLKNKSDKLVAFALLFLSKVYENETNEFYCSYPKIMNLTNIKDKKQVISIVNNLEKLGLLQIVKRNEIRKSIKVERGYKVYKEQNTYKMLLKYKEPILLYVVNENDLFKDFYKIYSICLNKYDFKVSRRFKENIKKYCGE